jgi:hypothetical protein
MFIEMFVFTHGTGTRTNGRCPALLIKDPHQSIAVLAFLLLMSSGLP